jgi:thymidylate kinase
VLVVLEGSDNTGKTTLAQELEKRGFRYVHNGPPASEGMFEEYARQIEAVQPDENVVFDRLHLGELVYGPVMRGRSRLSLAEARLLNRLIFARGGLLVYCSAPPDEIIASWRARQAQEYLQSTEQVEQVIKTYTTLWLDDLRDSPSVVRYRLAENRGNPGQFAEALRLRCLSRVDLSVRGAVGEPNAKYLIVGEAPGGRRDAAFCSMKNSSGFLNECLWRAGYTERELLFVNARDAQGTERNLRLVYRPGQVVIALGRVAETACHDQNITCVAAPHPQYVKRFKRDWHDGYVEMLKSFKEEPNEKVSYWRGTSIPRCSMLGGRRRAEGTR